MGTNHKTHMHCTHTHAHTHQKLLRTILVVKQPDKKDIECIFNSKQLKPWKIALMTNWKLSRKNWLVWLVRACKRKKEWDGESVCSRKTMYTKRAAALSLSRIYEYNQFSALQMSCDHKQNSWLQSSVWMIRSSVWIWKFRNEIHGFWFSFIAIFKLWFHFNNALIVIFF